MVKCILGVCVKMSDLIEDKKIIVCDFHSHILPCVDDGARDFDESIELIESVFRQGIRVLYATPHYYPRKESDEIKEVYTELLCKLRESDPDTADSMQIVLGQELVYHSELVECLRSGRALTMGESRHVLIEFDSNIRYQDMYSQLRELVSAGYIPVIAHVERYDVLKTEDNVIDLRRMGCLMQMNYDSIMGIDILGQKSKLPLVLNSKVKRVRNMVLDGYIDCFGTDMHRRDFRPPNITDSLEWLQNNIYE